MGAMFNDIRLEKRYHQLVGAFFQKPAAQLTQVLREWKQQKAGYRFLK